MRGLLPIVSLLLVTGSLARLPFYCRIRKPNCALRPNSKCCPAEENTTTTTTTTTAPTTLANTAIPVSNTPGDNTDKEEEDIDFPDDFDPEEEELVEEVVEEKKDEGDIDDAEQEVLEVAPSQIREVVVEAPETIPEPNQITPDSEVKYAPRFCLVLKFNCKSRSRHPCCSHPLPPRHLPHRKVRPRDQVHRDVVHRPSKDKDPVRAEATVRPGRPSVRPRTSLLRRPSQRTSALLSNNESTEQTPLDSPPAGDSTSPPSSPSPSSTDPSSVTSQSSFNSRTRLPRPSTARTPLDKTTRFSLLRSRGSRPSRPTRPPRPSSKPSTAAPRRSILRKRPVFGHGKSPVCRIVNCKRSPAHKCCKEEVTTTTETVTTVTEEVSDPMVTSTTPAHVTDREDILEEEMVVSHVASVSSVETRLVAATSPRKKESVTEEESEQKMVVSEMSYVQEDGVTTMSYKELGLPTPHQEEQNMKMVYETTVLPETEQELNSESEPEAEPETKPETEPKIESDTSDEYTHKQTLSEAHKESEPATQTEPELVAEDIAKAHSSSEAYYTQYSDYQEYFDYPASESKVPSQEGAHVMVPTLPPPSQPMVPTLLPLAPAQEPNSIGRSSEPVLVPSISAVPAHAPAHEAHTHVPVKQSHIPDVHPHIPPTSTHIHSEQHIDTSDIHSSPDRPHIPTSQAHIPVSPQHPVIPATTHAHISAHNLNTHEQQGHLVQDDTQNTSPVYIPHPVFVPEKEEKDRIREEVEERIEEEQRRLEMEERRQKELEEWRRQTEQLPEGENVEENSWNQEEKDWLYPSASSRETRLVTSEQEEEDVGEELWSRVGAQSRDSRVLPPRVSMECFRFDCLSSPDDPCCSRRKRQIHPEEVFTLPGLRKPNLLPGWRVEATVTRVEKSVHWGED